MNSPPATHLPAWAAPFGFRWFAPALLLAVCLGNLGIITFNWLHRPTSVSGPMLAALWAASLIGAVLMAIGWRALMRNSHRAPGAHP